MSQYDNTASITLGATHTGIIQPNTSYFGQPSLAEAIHNMHNFTVKQCENGWTISYSGKEFICSDVKEVGDRMVAILVQERLSK